MWSFFMENITWNSEKRKISELIPAEYNPRKLSEKQAANLATSINRFNLADPIIINQNNKIIGGHQRIIVISKQIEDGEFEIDVRVPSRLLTDHEERELNVRLNKNLGEFDFDLLANFDEEVLLDIGFEKWELDRDMGLDLDKEDDDGLKINKFIECPECGHNIKLRNKGKNNGRQKTEDI